jgi:hypothetical protein
VRKKRGLYKYVVFSVYSIVSTEMGKEDTKFITDALIKNKRCSKVVSMMKERSIGLKGVGIVLLGIIIPFLLSRLMIVFINEFLRSNWQYHLFEDYESNILFANWIMASLILGELLFASIFYRKKKVHK